MPDKKAKIILFDFDGTLADTLPLAFRIFNQLMVEKNRLPIPDDHLELWRSKGARKFLADIGLPIWRAPYYLRRVQREMKPEMAKVLAFPGMEGLLHSLRGQGYKLGLITTNTKENVQNFFTTHGFPQFDFYYSRSAIFGKARILKGLCKKYGIRPSEAIYVGDEVRDIEAAHAVGMPMVAVTWGYNNKVALEALSPRHLISNPDELAKILLK
jgi:HAD superfamily hydrolase (TIGR01509 family)